MRKRKRDRASVQWKERWKKESDRRFGGAEGRSRLRGGGREGARGGLERGKSEGGGSFGRNRGPWHTGFVRVQSAVLR